LADTDDEGYDSPGKTVFLLIFADILKGFSQEALTLDLNFNELLAVCFLAYEKNVRFLRNLLERVSIQGGPPARSTVRNPME